MKQLTEAQVMGFRGSMPPRTEHRYSVNVEPDAAARQAAKHLTTARRAIEVYQEWRALRREMEI